LVLTFDFLLNQIKIKSLLHYYF